MMCILKAGPSVGPNPVTGKGILQFVCNSGIKHTVHNEKNKLLALNNPWELRCRTWHAC